MPSFPSALALLLPVALLASSCKKEQPESTPRQNYEIAVTEDGFVPAAGKVKVGEPVTLLVTRKTDQTCAKDIVIKDYGVKEALPKDRAVKVTFTPTKPGPVRFACDMDMVAGELVAE